MGLEPMTSSLPMKCSTTELQQPSSRSGDHSRAGEGNRTLVFSLEGCCSTIELHPLIKPPTDSVSSQRKSDGDCQPGRKINSHRGQGTQAI